ncbi:3'-5' exonuclease [Marinobacter fonticola]|uniref:3'-5' exonuclease n=1 Tax=Marinobacter fonticola TaxID=2603215 RepID=UPI0011E83CBA|nr:3'-5' exonuclease [Marinobacter fonticola]
MIHRIKEWLEHYFSNDPDRPGLEHLPRAKTPGPEPLTGQRLIVLDLETTGLNPAKDHVIAIGAVAIENLGIPLANQFDLILRRPELDIRETVLIHGIGPDALTRGHEIEEALIRLLSWMNGDPILAFHSAFDKRFLEKALKAQLGYTREHTWLDVAEILPALFEPPGSGGRLDDWTDHFGLQVSERHHAAADAMATAELALIALNRAIREDLSTLSQLNEKLRIGRRLKHLQSP